MTPGMRLGELGEEVGEGWREEERKGRGDKEVRGGRDGRAGGGVACRR